MAQVNANAVAESILTQQNSAANANAIAETLLLTQATLVKANAVAETLLTVAPKNIQDTYVQME
ncbi:hypothetical protein, partial [Enterococcus faecalis]